MPDTESTIVAIATARGAAGVAIVRLSGPKAWPVGKTIFSPSRPFASHRVHHGWITDAGTPLDEVLLLPFKGPHSYTGDDVLEIHCHGGERISQAIVDLCLRYGARLAMPGEYTLRAFLNGKMDLTQAESVMDLVSARSGRLLAQASANLKNRSLGQYIDDIGRKLLEVQSQIVAAVDFPDEVAEPDRAVLRTRLDECLTHITRLTDSALRNRMVRDGLKVAILGMPNAGKSSLFNRLLATERSIVTSEAGTTRDVVTESFDLEGVVVTLIDTAGIRESGQRIEMMGIARSWQAAEEAQVILYLVDASVGLLRYDRQVLSRLDSEATLVVGNKRDLLNGRSAPDGWIMLSARTGEGMEALYDALRRRIHRISPEDADVVLSLNRRQIECCQAIQRSLMQTADDLGNVHTPLDVVTIPLTEALRTLDELMGRDTSEEVLSRVFQQFCVGK